MHYTVWTCGLGGGGLKWQLENLKYEGAGSKNKKGEGKKEIIA